MGATVVEFSWILKERNTHAIWATRYLVDIRILFDLDLKCSSEACLAYSTCVKDLDHAKMFLTSQIKPAIRQIILYYLQGRKPLETMQLCRIIVVSRGGSLKSFLRRAIRFRAIS